MELHASCDSTVAMFSHKCDVFSKCICMFFLYRQKDLVIKAAINFHNIYFKILNQSNTKRILHKYAHVCFRGRVQMFLGYVSAACLGSLPGEYALPMY